MTTHWMMCAVLLGLLCNDPAATAGAEETNGVVVAEPSVLAIYDIEGLGQGPVENRVGIQMMPFAPTENERHGEESLELGDVVESLLYEVVAPEAFEYEGRSFHRTDDGRLIVVAPPALQERIAQLMNGLRAAFGRTARIALDVYAVAPGRSLPLVIDEEELVVMTNSGLLKLVHRRSDQVRMGYTEHIKALNSTTVVEEWQGEIAQNASIPTPGLGELDTGIDLLIRVEDVPGSSSVRVRQSLGVSELRDLGTHEISLYDPVRLENSLYEDGSREAQDLPIVSTSSTVGSVVMAVGEGLVSVGHTATLAGGASWVTHLRVLEVDPAPAPLVFGETSVAFLDTSAATWPSFRSPEWTATTLASRSNHDSGERLRGLRALGAVEAMVWFPSEDRLDWEGPFWECETGMLSSEEDADVWDERWSWQQTPWAVWAAPTERLNRSLELWPLFVGSRKNLVVEMGVTELSGPGGAAREVARGRLCIESGSAGHLLFGDMVVLPRGFDVDVATGAAIANPQVASVFDGLYVRASADGRGESVQLTVASSQLRGREDVTLSTIAPGTFERPSFSLADVRVKVPTDGQRRVVAELDGSLDRGESRMLWVAVRAR